MTAAGFFFNYFWFFFSFFSFLRTFLHIIGSSLQLWTLSQKATLSQ